MDKTRNGISELRRPNRPAGRSNKGMFSRVSLSAGIKPCPQQSNYLLHPHALLCYNAKTTTHSQKGAPWLKALKKAKVAKKVADMPMAYDQAIADKVCELIMEGYSLRKIEATDKMPKRLDILRWLRENKDFQTQYAHAREEQADSLADEILDIADKSDLPSDDRRVKIDVRKWYAGKLRPKKYGDKIDLNHGGQPENPVVTITASDEQILQRYMESKKITDNTSENNNKN